MMTSQIFEKLGVEKINPGTHIGAHKRRGEKTLFSYSPITGEKLAEVGITSREEFQETIQEASKAFLSWRKMTPPKRGEIIRQYGNELRKHKAYLGELVSVEMGKSIQEGQGEVQEMIDICDLAVGLSRQLYGKVIASERSDHHMYERWHPLGIVGIISAFNFPVAVWSWNAMIALVCGNVCIWKPSEKTPLCAISCQNILIKVLQKNGVQEAVSSIINGDKSVGEWLADEPSIALVSATGSTKMGKEVAVTVGRRLGKMLLELGGNNAMIISGQADLKLAVRAAVFGAVGTAGQRCTSTRRLIIHSSVYAHFVELLKEAYQQIHIGNPLDKNNHMGPLIDQAAVDNYLDALVNIKNQGGRFIVEGGLYSGPKIESTFYVKPCIAEISPTASIIQEESFSPILYVIKYDHLEEAIDIQNGVRQGLSSSLMTGNLQEAERFMSAEGSDCGIANINVGTSGAEIGGAFGGEKDTGGGRESGSDAWKAYMRRQTNTVNFGKSLPLAQGISFTF
jgi:aldehyde dehydrogenase (NAD+)